MYDIIMPVLVFFGVVAFGLIASGIYGLVKYFNKRIDD